MTRILPYRPHTRSEMLNGLQHESDFQSALAARRAGDAGFVKYLILRASETAHSPLVMLDKRLSKVTRATLHPPPFTHYYSPITVPASNTVLIAPSLFNLLLATCYLPLVTSYQLLATRN